MVINIYRYSYNDSNYSEEGKQKKKIKYIQNHTIEFWPLSPFILISGISKYFTFCCSTAVTVRNKIILTLFASPQQSPCFAND